MSPVVVRGRMPAVTSGAVGLSRRYCSRTGLGRLGGSSARRRGVVVMERDWCWGARGRMGREERPGAVSGMNTRGVEGSCLTSRREAP